MYLVGKDKKLGDYMASFIAQMEGPFGNPTHVLCMQNKADDPDHGSTSRNEYSFFGRKQREDGNYPRYHQLNGYIVTNVTNNQDGAPRHRLRVCPGFELITERNAYENELRTVHHITVEKRGRYITYAVDGQTILEASGDELLNDYTRGLLGFRTWHTELWWDNLVVTQLSE